MDNQHLINAIQDIKNGRKASAQTALVKSIQGNPACQDSWYWLGEIVENEVQRRYCYQRVLAINPKNKYAWQAIQRLDNPESVVTVESQPVDAPVSAIPAENNLPDAVQEVSPKPAKIKKSFSEKLKNILPSLKSYIIVQKTRLLIGILTGFIPYTLIVALLIFTGQMDYDIMASALSQMPPMPNTYTHTYPPFIEATQIPVPEQSAQVRYEKAIPMMEAAQEHFDQAENATALEALDRAALIIPDSPNVYFERSLGNMGRFVAVMSQSLKMEALYASLSDINKAISLQPDIGDYYATRGQIYYYWAKMMEGRADKEILFQTAIENLDTAKALGYSDRFHLDVIYALSLLESGQCELAQDYVANYQNREGTSGTYYQTMNRIIPYSYSCLGQYDQALSTLHYLSNNGEVSAEQVELQAYIAYMQGQPDESLRLLNEISSNFPDHHTAYYYLRGLIYFDRGDWDGAYNELNYGGQIGMLHGGLYPYVQGLMGLSIPGDLFYQQSISEIQYAKESISPFYPGLEEMIQEKIESLNIGNVAETPQVPAATSFPTPTPGATLRPTQTPTPVITSEESADTNNLTSTPAPDDENNLAGLEETTPTGIVKILNMNASSGPMQLALGVERSLKFQPETALSIDQITSLELVVRINQDPETYPEISIWNVYYGTWEPVDVFGGDHNITNPEYYIAQEGDIYLKIYCNRGAANIDNISFILEIIDTENQTRVYGGLIE